MTTEKDNNTEMETQHPRNFVAKYARQINKSGKIESGKDKQRRRQPKHRNKEHE